jgi:2'-5' RNA ligase
MIRLFAALPIPYDIAQPLKHRQQGVPRARWSPEENLHITLRFFGEVDEAKADELDLALGRICVPPFEVALAGVDAFGEGEAVRSIHAKVVPSPELERLAAKCETAARKVGLTPELRNFRPHLTLAYLKRSPPDRVAAWLAGHNLLHSPAWRADHFALYSSWSGPDGSQYEVERVYRLG